VATNFKWDVPSRHERKKADALEHAANMRQWDAEIDRRDGRRCRACGRRSDPDGTGLLERGHRHHIVYRSAGGSDEPSNRVTLCAGCHDAEHMNKLRFSHDGDHRQVDANKPMEFWRRAHGEWSMSRREIGIHVVERD
jgi:5-methylcytosine-specific restriction endonuclease McrA